MYCDRCKKKCNTILRTAISALPDVLMLSLKRFDLLDYNTFETVKLNSRCAFGHTLNVKKYTLEGVEASTNAVGDRKSLSWTRITHNRLCYQMMTMYDYRLVVVVVHAGVDQGGHYFTVIKDRSKQE